MAARGVKELADDSELSDSDYDDSLYEDPEELEYRTAQDTKGWNLFRDVPTQQQSGSMVSTVWVDTSVKVLKFLSYIIVFAVVLGTAMIAKGTLLFITSQLKKDRVIHHCNKLLALDQQFITTLSLEERITWLWAAWVVFSTPEIFIFLQSARICFFKITTKPNNKEFIAAFIIDTLHTIGIAILVLIVLPDMDVVKGAMLMNAMCLIPGILNLISRDSTDPYYQLKIVLDVMAISAQITAFIVWPLGGTPKASLWCIPISCLFISLGWWENYINYVDKKSSVTLTFLRDLRDGLQKSRFYTQRILSIWKIGVFMACILLSLHLQEDDPLSFFTSFREAFGERYYAVEEVQINLEEVFEGIDNITPTGATIEELPMNWSASVWVAGIQVLAGYICYATSKFACKILIQNFSFTFALSLVGPATINGLVVFSGIRNGNPCAFQGVIPDYLFFEIPPVYIIWQYIARERVWIWLFWLISQAWITFHTWQPRCERLAATEKLFRMPWYSGVVIDQSLLLNRTKDDETEFPVEDDDDPYNESMINGDMKYAPDVRPSDSVTRIYVCATMWHETREEIMEFLKSIFRLDEDQSAHRVARKYLKIINNDYYELETHIFMDDAFEISDHSAEDSQVNRFVKCLMEVMNEAASVVHLTHVKLRPPKKYPTPYGGRLVWTLPGKTKLICHLKDKSKIRHRKRWSQVMYMYYLLGHRLMDLPISVERKEVVAQNTYLLALDGDIDFQPSAVHLLVDLMKKNMNLGAACGRIHPVGSGFMAWYQKFEYAIGHWLQKATEHMIGCVLCSPGCFSLFRGKALMDDNVMKKYTLTPHEARHYVQYDQGEDRWLCTLLLQRGYRVEYSAASDAYTHCPEHFDEFFNQRRRWVPSTMANIFDLLADYKRTVKINDNISMLYIMYQMMLMVGSILGPGTIFLMLVGALNLIMGVSNVTALLWNLLPIGTFIVICFTCKSDVQLMVANLITCFYAMMMVIVVVGIVLQIIEDGWLAPTSIFTVIVFSTFFITAAMHPQEIGCLPYLIIYYITIPSMYMLLIIYSVSNLNNVSWGTREVVQKKTAKELEMEKIETEKAMKSAEKQNILAQWLGTSADKSGSVECGVAGLFKCMCCTNPEDHKEDLYLLQISNKLDSLDKRLTSLGAEDDVKDTTANTRRRSSIGLRRETLGVLNEYAESDNSTDIPREERDDLINPYWVEDPQMEKGEVDFLTTAETEFWKDFIDAYLRPIDENKEEKERIELDLKNLRNIMVFAFVMLNALFVLVVFMLQLNQDQLHFRWPLGQKVQITFDDDSNIINITREYLMLEPIGTLFIVFFGVVMAIQFVAMMMHRFGTLTHLLSTVQLNFYCIKQVEELSQNAHIESNGIQIVRDLQKLNHDDLKSKKTSDVGRRKTVQNLMKGRESKNNFVNLDATFKRRLTIVLQDPDQASTISRLPSLGGNEETRRATLRALQTRRDSIRPSRNSQTHLYERKQTMSGQSSPGRGAYFNRSYEPALDSDDDNMGSPMPRRSTVRFRETFT